MLDKPHTQVAILDDDAVSTITPLLPPDIACKKLVLFVTDEGKKRLPAVQQVLGPRGVTLLTFEIADDKLPLQQLALDTLPGDTVVVNVSDGHMGHSHQLLSWRQQHQLPGFWLDTRNDTLQFLHCPDTLPLSVPDRLKLTEYLALNGMQVKQVNRQPERLNQLLPLARHWANNISFYQQGLRSLNYLAMKANGVTLSCPLDHQMTQNQALQQIIDELQEFELACLAQNQLTFKDELARSFCNGIWLEYFCFGEFSRLRQQRDDVQDIAISLEIERQVKGQYIRNELDVVALINNRLYVVECKTANLDAKDSQLALYKLDMLTDCLNALTQGLLISALPVSTPLRKRALELDLTILDNTRITALLHTLQLKAEKFEFDETGTT